MESLEGYLNGLQRSGEQHSQGHFTLDPARAREMLERFQVQDGENLGLHALAMAVASRANRCEFHAGPDSLRISFPGQTLTALELQDAPSALFVRDASPTTTRLREVCLVLQSARALGARAVEIRCADACLRLQSPDYSWQWVEGSASSTQIVVDFRPVRLWAALTQDRYDPAGILERVARRGRWAPLRLALDGETLPFPGAPRYARLVSLIGAQSPVAQPMSVRTPSFPLGVKRAILLFDPGPDTPHELHVVVYGVDHVYDFPGAGWGVVYCDDLRKDASESELLLEDLGTLLRQVRLEHAAHLLDLAGEFQPGGPHWEKSQRAIALRTFLTPRVFQRREWATGLPDGWPEKVESGLEAFPVCPVAGGGWASLTQMQDPAWRRTPELMFVQRGLAGPVPDFPILDLRDTVMLRALREEGLPLAPADALLAGQAEIEKRRQIFLVRPQQKPPALAGMLWARLGLPQEMIAEGWEGEAGLYWPEAAGLAKVSLFYQDRFLDSRTLPMPSPMDGVQLAVQHPDLRPTPDWRGAVWPEERLADLRGLLGYLYRPLVLQAAARWRKGEVEPNPRLRADILRIWHKDASLQDQLQDLPLFPLVRPRAGDSRAEALDLFSGPAPPDGGEVLLGAADLPATPAWEAEHASWRELLQQGLPLPCARASWPGQGPGLTVRLEPNAEGLLTRLTGCRLLVIAPPSPAPPPPLVPGALCRLPLPMATGRGEVALVIQPEIPVLHVRVRIQEEGRLVREHDLSEDYPEPLPELGDLRILAILESPSREELPDLPERILTAARRLGFHCPEVCPRGYLMARLLLELRAGRADEIVAELRRSPLFPDGRSLDELRGPVPIGPELAGLLRQLGEF